jgi:hypothetical protein
VKSPFRQFYHLGSLALLLGSGEIEGKSSGGSVFAGTTTEAVDRVADEVVRLVHENI